MTSTSPEVVVDCWPVTLPAGCPDFVDPTSDAYDPVRAEVVTVMAVSALRALTAWQVGGCPVDVRPCPRACVEPTWRAYPVLGGAWFTPVLDHGTWLNVTCGCRSSCACVLGDRVPVPAGRVLEVWVSGMRLADAAWARAGGDLVRLDGDTWPARPDVTAGRDDADSFVVVMAAGRDPGPLGAYAAGLMVCEFARALVGDQACALPPNATQVVRNGTTVALAEPEAGDLFPGGRTGIQSVDLFISMHNPHQLREAPQVWSPSKRTPLAAGQST